MDIRKLQQTGGASLTITLPKKWIAKNSLKDKDILRVIESKLNFLLLEPVNNKKKLLSFTINTENLTEGMLIREIIACYIAGVDELTIVSKYITPSQRVGIRSLCNSLVGFELIDESSGKISIRNIFDYTKLPIQQNVQKITAITKQMLSDSFKSISGDNPVLAHDVVDRDFEVDKLYWALSRQYFIFINDISLEEDIGLSQLEINYYYRVATQLERIADHAVKISQITLTLGKEHSLTGERKNSILNISSIVMNLFESARETVEKIDKNRAHELLDAIEKIENAQKTRNKDDKESQRYFSLVEESYNRIRGYLMNIGELTIDQWVLERKL